MKLTLYEVNVETNEAIVCCIVHSAALELGLFPPPASPCTAHRTTGEMSERTTRPSTDRTIHAPRGMGFIVGEGGAIG
jgi:hypothetical protein